MFGSIRKKYAVITILLVAGTLLACWFMNNTFLSVYYEWDKSKLVEGTYQKINQAVNNGTLNTEEFQAELYQYAWRYNIGVEVIDANSEIIIAASYNGNEMTTKLLTYIMKLPVQGVEDGIPEVNKVFKAVDRRSKTESIEMYGQLDNNCWYIITAPVESIQDSVRLANRFLAYIGVVSCILSGIIILIVSKKFTDPILKLADISERMTHLDFEAKYEGRRDSHEIALLGNNINQLSESLESTISELKTANNELKKDIEKKEQIDEMRKDFLSNVSHELKTPIALIQGYAEGLKDGISDDPESMEFYCDVIIDESAKMNTMVKKLLDLNRLEFGNDIVSMERFDIVALVRNYLQSAGILIKQNEISIRMNEENSIYVWADEFKIEEVFMNYFTNAVNHCEGDRVIDIQFENKNGKVRVCVFNTGKPIPEDSIEHIWEKFYKVDKARTREYGGSGVGLSIVKAIMESHGQDYGVQNFNNGVQFWFELDTVEV